MPITRAKIERNLRTVRERIAAACARRRRDPAEVSMVAVTKSVDMDTIRNLLDVGLTDLGESRVRNLVLRAGQMEAYLKRRRNELAGPVRWHMVGHLQRNKVRDCLEAASYIHSVDSLRLAEEINARAEQMERSVDVLLQVNCSQEPQKFGCAVGAATHLAETVDSLKRIRLIGLMTMGAGGKELATRLGFVRLRELFEEMRREKIGGESFRHLSMGMSDDYEVAVEEGATVLRIGRALFA